MKAAYVESGGDQNSIKFGAIPHPGSPGDDQVLVRLLAAGVNPIDGKIRATPQRFPVCSSAILGCDGAGMIEQTGKNIRDFAPGDEVYFSQPGFNGRQGTYAEYALVDSCLLAHKPKRLSFTAAAAAPLVLITAWEALYNRARIRAGQKVLVHAGAGGVGHVAIQLASNVGCEVASTVSSSAKAEFVSQLGATKAIIYPAEDTYESIMAWTQQQGVEVVFDTVGGKTLESSFSYTRLFGDIVTILQPVPDLDWGEARKRNLRLSLELMLSPVLLEHTAAKQYQGNILRECAKLIDNDKLQIHVAETFPLQKAADAHRYLDSQHPMGKVVISIQE